MSALTPFFLDGPDGKHLRGDRAVGQGRRFKMTIGSAVRSTWSCSDEW